MSRVVVIALLLALSVPGFAQSVRVDLSDENAVLRLSVSSYALTGSKLGERAPPGYRYLVVRGLLENRNTQQGADVPNAADAFPLLINGGTTIPLDPLSADTADAYWGPQVLQPGERRPVEFVYTIPSEGVERAEIRHLSDKGRISLFILGEAEPARTEFPFGPVDLGVSRLAVGELERLSSFGGFAPRPGYYLLRVEYWYTNLRELQPLETNIASLSALETDGGYTFQSLTLPPPGAPLPAEMYHAGEPTAGELVFEIPEQARDLVLVHYTEDGALRVPLSTTGTRTARARPTIAGPSRDGTIEVSVYAQALTPNGLTMDIGLRLNHNDGMADLPLDLSSAFELHRTDGSFVNASPNFPGLVFPITRVLLRRDQLDYGQLGFPGVGPGSYTLVLPLASGPVRLRLPRVGPIGNNPTAQRPPPTPAPTAPQGGPTGMLPGFDVLSPGSSTAPAQPSPAEPARAAPATSKSDAQASSAAAPAAPAPESAPRPAPKPARRDLSQLTGIPQVIDTGTLSLRFDTVPLYGISGEGEPYRTQLEAYIRDREVSCERLKTAYRCTLEGDDLSEIVLRNGAGRATDDAPDALKATAADAKSRGVGIWQ